MTFRSLRKAFGLPLLAVFGGAFCLGWVYFSFLRIPEGIWILAVPVGFVLALVQGLGLLGLIAMAALELAVRLGAGQPKAAGRGILPLPAFDPQARLRLPKELKDRLARNRGKEISAAKDFVSSGGRLLLILGEGGVGKSSLAATLARRTDLWVNLRGIDVDLPYLVFQCAGWLQHEDLAKAAVAARELKETSLEKLGESISRKKRRLFFIGLENLLDESGGFKDEKIAEFFHLLLTLPGKHSVVVTSRAHPEWGNGLQNLESLFVFKLSGLDGGSGAELLRAGSLPDAAEKWLEEISEGLDGNPLLLRVVSPMLAGGDADEIILKKSWTDPKREHLVSRLFLKKAAGDGYEILLKMSLIPEPLSKDLLINLAGDRLDGESWLKELSSRSLIEWDAGLKKYLLHPDISACLRSHLHSRPWKVRKLQRSVATVCIGHAEGSKPVEQCSSLGDCALYLRALDLLLEAGDQTGSVELLLRLGEVLSEWGYFRLLENLNGRAAALSVKSWYSTKRQLKLDAELFKRSAGLYYDAGNHSRAREWYKALFLIALRLGDRGLKALACSRLSIIYRALGRYRTARWLSGIEIYLASKWKGEEGAVLAVAHGRLGHVYREMGKPEQAETHYQIALELFHGNGLQRGEALALGYLGQLYLKREMPAEAINVLDTKLEILDKLGSKKQYLSTMEELVVAHQSAGEIDTAVDICRKLSRLALGFEEWQTASKTLAGLFRVYFNREQYSAAIDVQRSRLEIADKTGDEGLAGSALGNIGNARSRMGQPEKAIESYNLAREKLLAAGRQRDAEKCGFYITEQYMAQRDWRNATNNAIAAIASALEHDGPNIDKGLQLISLCRDRLGARDFNETCKEALGKSKFRKIAKQISALEKAHEENAHQ